ncbi:MAG: DUF1801 domain-containing protein [Calditrichaeota bacterium]|nr:MAG: DUF1801 domain-containing protein [Calditrichota bacterium]MBL1205794.1 DUF1801 domain-containing protein [Calditrichota bacterium]NOG45622.1 DUF1801 domain-containing protein [Calditrichota bacterium]
MAEVKTVQNNNSVNDFLNQVENPVKREDCYALMKIMKTITGEEAKMWGPSIVGFGSYHFKYASGREGDFMLAGFSPRKQNITLYIMAGFDNYENLMNKLGKYTTGKSCLYIKKLADIDLDILKKLITESVEYIKNKAWP